MSLSFVSLFWLVELESAESIRVVICSLVVEAGVWSSYVAPIRTNLYLSDFLMLDAIRGCRFRLQFIFLGVCLCRYIVT